MTAQRLLKCKTNLAVYSKLSEKQPDLVAAFWKYLLVCFETPRPSTDYKEPNDPHRLDQIRKILSTCATSVGATAEEDEAGNLIIRKEGKGTGVGKPWLCLQGHLDMVCSENSVVGHDFEKDPIEVRFSSDDGMTDGWLKPVKATSLGADNGIALAAGLAVMETLPNHPPLELLCTANEETDFHGAEGVKGDSLKAKTLLNLDSEEEYSICVGCAGGFEHSYKLPYEALPIDPDWAIVNVNLSGFHGGHSGVDIDKEYGNAIKSLARILLSTGQTCRLLDCQGGTGPNSIPREASCVIALPRAELENFETSLQSAFDEVKAELKSTDPDATLSISACAASVTNTVPPDVPPIPTGEPPRKAAKGVLVGGLWRCSRCPKCQAAAIAEGEDGSDKAGKSLKVPSTALSASDTTKVWKFLALVPHGVLRKSTEVEDLVESSVCCSMLALREDHLFCHLFLRSSVTSYMKYGQRMLSAYGDLAGAENVENQVPFPAWQPCMESPLLALCKKTHVEVFRKEPKVYAVHAGLECGILKERKPELDCCSIGPWICNAHSPDERVHIESGARFVKWLSVILDTWPADCK